MSNLQNVRDSNLKVLFVLMKMYDARSICSEITYSSRAPILSVCVESVLKRKRDGDKERETQLATLCSD